MFDVFRLVSADVSAVVAVVFVVVAVVLDVSCCCCLYCPLVLSLSLLLLLLLLLLSSSSSSSVVRRAPSPLHMTVSSFTQVNPKQHVVPEHQGQANRDYAISSDNPHIKFQ
ncbi:hypothetical protein CCHR01_16021 [Colletotrichum chrysophilum]|uniref:Uncharacterized protein n=1 Tax=Colletotrichum chrysophilum TaxID=1836956 RepID=A0AAD9A579_9PEZI|nr:hypothetical protein CCHR01_16021 [Colletotrichum chrysophilum]